MHNSQLDEIYRFVSSLLYIFLTARRADAHPCMNIHRVSKYEKSRNGAAEVRSLLMPIQQIKSNKIVCC